MDVHRRASLESTISSEWSDGGLGQLCDDEDEVDELFPPHTAAAMHKRVPMREEFDEDDESDDQLLFEREDELERQCAHLQRRVLHSATLTATYCARERQRATKRVVFMALRVWAKMQAAPRQEISTTRAIAAERAVQARAETDALRQLCIDRLARVRQRSAAREAFVVWREDARRKAWQQRAREKLQEELESARQQAKVVALETTNREVDISEMQMASAGHAKFLEERIRNLTIRLVAARCRIGEVRWLLNVWIHRLTCLGPIT